MVSMDAFQAFDGGSIPPGRTTFCPLRRAMMRSCEQGQTFLAAVNFTSIFDPTAIVKGLDTTALSDGVLYYGKENPRLEWNTHEQTNTAVNGVSPESLH